MKLLLLVFVAFFYVAQADQAESLKLPALPYPYEALEPNIGRQTMITHHTKHQQAYATNCLNLLNTLSQASGEMKFLVDQGYLAVLKNVHLLPHGLQHFGNPVINQCGGFINHVQFFEHMRSPIKDNAPVVGTPLSDAIIATYGSFNELKKMFTATATGVFGSGWAWLIVNPNGALEITTTVNQDTPIRDGSAVILALDVWEHAYYLDYKNVRANYVNSFYELINWDKANEWYVDAIEPENKSEL